MPASPAAPARAASAGRAPARSRDAHGQGRPRSATRGTARRDRGCSVAPFRPPPRGPPRRHDGHGTSEADTSSRPAAGCARHARAPAPTAAAPSPTPGAGTPSWGSARAAEPARPPTARALRAVLARATPAPTPSAPRTTGGSGPGSAPLTPTVTTPSRGPCPAARAAGPARACSRRSPRTARTRRTAPPPRSGPAGPSPPARPPDVARPVAAAPAVPRTSGRVGETPVPSPHSEPTRARTGQGAAVRISSCPMDGGTFRESFVRSATWRAISSCTARRITLAAVAMKSVAWTPISSCARSQGTSRRRPITRSGGGRRGSSAPLPGGFSDSRAASKRARSRRSWK